MAKTNKFIFWTPRIIIILFALFLAIFSLDVFGNNYGFWETIIGLFMHNLPSIILLIILIIFWKHDLFGGVIFITLGIACLIGIFILMLNIPEGSRFNIILIIGSIMFLLIGILFLVGWKQKKKDKQKKLVRKI
jgi:hypothetical protein